MTWTRKILLLLLFIVAAITLTDYLLLATMTPLARENSLLIIYRKEIEEARTIASRLEFGSLVRRDAEVPTSPAINENPTLLLVELVDASDSTVGRLGGRARSAQNFGYTQLQSVLPGNRERIWFKWVEPGHEELQRANAVIYTLPVQSDKNEEGLLKFYIDLDALQRRFPNNEIPF